MAWTGKIIGGVLGSLIGPWGTALGIGIGLLPTTSNAVSNTSLVLQMLGEGTQVGNLADVSARVGVDLSEQDVGFALTDFACHEMDVIDPASKLKLGRGIDCLANITPDENGGLTLTGVSIFLLPGGTITAVPVPAAMWLFGSALGGLGWMRRRKTT